ncbi:hypothetical protein [Nocardia sp. NPDC057030]|uniref:hypothetical protein n=1 Tax=unclassified Nocardia TaxID=2637762 RepID=UPI00362BA9BE
MPDLASLVTIAITGLVLVAFFRPEILSGQRQRLAMTRELEVWRHLHAEMQDRLDRVDAGRDDRAALVRALNQVQAAETTVPLPRQVRDAVDDALSRHRASMADGR